MTRDEARTQGIKRYTPLRPCVHGHTADRYVGNNDCVECSAIRALAYGRANKEAAKAKSAIWRAANPEQHRQNARNAYDRNPQKYRDNTKQWANDNPERVKENARRTYATNPERTKAQARAWAKANPGKVRAILRRNRKSRNAAKVPLSKEDKAWLEKIYAERPEGMEVDHVYPVNGTNSCGLHVPWNLQYLAPIPNREKGNKLPLNGHLLGFRRSDNDNLPFRKVA